MSIASQIVRTVIAGNFVLKNKESLQEKISANSNYPVQVYYALFGLAIVFPKHFVIFCQLLEKNQLNKLEMEKVKAFKKIGHTYLVANVDKNAKKYDTLKKAIKVNEHELEKVTQLSIVSATYETIGNIL